MVKVKGKRGFWKILAPVCLALIMCFSFVGCVDAPAKGGTTNKALAGFVSVDINPSVEFTTDDAGKVTAVRAANDDARVLLSDMKLVGLTLEEAVKQVTSAAEAAGYLNDKNKKVKISAAGETAEATTELGKEAKTGATSGSDIADVSEAAKKSLEREVAKLKELDSVLYADLTPAKLRIINTIIEYNPEFTTAEGAKMTVKDLSAMAKELYEKFEDMVSDELEDEFDLLIDAKTAIIDLKIDAIYGVEYLAKATILRAVETLEDTLELALENAEIVAEDVTKLVAELGLENSDALKQDGKITLESVEAFIEKMEDEWEDKSDADDEAMEAKLDAVEALIEKYDEDTATFTTEMIAQIKAIVQDVAIDSLEALEDYADTLEEELDELKETIELTDEQKAKIEELEKEKDAIEDEVKKEMKVKIDAAKQSLKDLKEQKIKDNKKTENK